jgi:hypothetical protein
MRTFDGLTVEAALRDWYGAEGVIASGVGNELGDGCYLDVEFVSVASNVSAFATNHAVQQSQAPSSRRLRRCGRGHLYTVLLVHVTT